MVCHGELARLRPAPRHLTEFYLWMAFGGVLGGAFAALAAPLVFDAVLEYPIALVAACLLRPRIGEGRRRPLLDVLLPLAVLLLIWLRPRAQSLGLPDLGSVGVLLFLVPAALLIFGAAAWPLRFGLALAAALTPVMVGAGGHRVLDRERSFFGVYTVERDPAGYDVLVHGTTVHGAQALDPRTRREPLTYYHRAGPLGQLMSALDPPPRTVGAVGLGVGTVACYRTPGQRWTFYEIDPLVLQIARDGRYFHYLADCAPAAEVVLGDARLSLQGEPSGSFDLLILDAFSSDAIPVHLLTREAWRLYLDKLAQGGVIALHVSNRNLDLVPVVGDVIADVGASARVERYDPPAEAVRAYRSASVWIAVARRDADLGALAGDPRWRRLEARPGARPWTDDFSNIVGALRWRWPL
ncbi:MAG: fused MFS/spermidine synthase, partial [Geminicoccales bacterium]